MIQGGVRKHGQVLPSWRHRRWSTSGAEVAAAASAVSACSAMALAEALASRSSLSPVVYFARHATA